MNHQFLGLRELPFYKLSDTPCLELCRGLLWHLLPVAPTLRLRLPVAADWPLLESFLQE